MKEKRLLSISSMSVLICCTALVLTSCSEREAEDKSEKLLQLELLRVNAQKELQADKALLAEELKIGASPDQIAAIQKEIRADQILLRKITDLVIIVFYEDSDNLYIQLRR